MHAPCISTEVASSIARLRKRFITALPDMSQNCKFVYDNGVRLIANKFLYVYCSY